MRKPLIASLLSVTLVTLFLSSVPAVHAEPIPDPASGNPMVLVAVDATAESNCQETFHINTQWHTTPPPDATPLIASTTTTPCPAGMILKTAKIPLALALVQHEPYVPMPANPERSTTTESAAIHSLLDAKRQSLAFRTVRQCPTSHRLWRSEFCKCAMDGR